MGDLTAVLCFPSSACIWNLMGAPMGSAVLSSRNIDDLPWKLSYSLFKKIWIKVSTIIFYVTSKTEVLDGTTSMIFGLTSSTCQVCVIQTPPATLRTNSCPLVWSIWSALRFSFSSQVVFHRGYLSLSGRYILPTLNRYFANRAYPNGPLR